MCRVHSEPGRSCLSTTFLPLYLSVKIVFFAISTNPCPAKQLHKLVRQLIHCFPLSVLPSIYPVSLKFSKPSFFIVCSSSFNYLSLMQSISVIFVSIFSKTSLLLTYSVHGILIILLQNHVSVASNHFFFSFVRRLSRIHFHIKGTILHNSLVLFYLFVFLFLNTLFSFWKVSFSILMHLRISVLYFAFSVQALPRYLNLLYLLDFDISNL